MASSATPKEKFDAAVNVIHSLPKNAIHEVMGLLVLRSLYPGQSSFQPSYAMMLSFYGLYKQATLGSCNISKPGFWDVIGKAKWDAWKRLGSMPQEVAMTQYVDELKKIIETMPHTDNVQEFVERLGDFYEVVDDDTPIAQMVRNASPKQLKAGISARRLPPELTDLEASASTRNGLGPHGRLDVSSYSSTDSSQSSPRRSSPAANIDAGHSSHVTSSAAGGHRANGPGEPTSESGSDGDEFLDTLDSSHLQDDPVILQSSSVLSSDPDLRLSNLDGASSRISPVAGKPRSSNRTTASHPRPLDLVPNGEEEDHRGTTEATSDRLVLALGRLQQDMNSALVRLQAMETLFMAQKETLERTRLSQRKPNVSSSPQKLKYFRRIQNTILGWLELDKKWRLFASMNYPTIAFLIAWPFVIHLMLRYMTRKRN